MQMFGLMIKVTFFLRDMQFGDRLSNSISIPITCQLNNIYISCFSAVFLQGLKKNSTKALGVINSMAATITIDEQLQ